jgi:hypothetical protein
MGLPGPLVEVRSSVDNPFTEVLAGQRELLNRFAGFGTDHKELGASFEACALIKEAVAIEEALGVTGGGMRIFRDDLIAVNGNLRLRAYACSYKEQK